MEPEFVTYFTPLCVMLIMLFCCLRFAIKSCIRRNNMTEFYSTQYCNSASHQCNRIFVGDGGGVHSVVITRLPTGGQQACPQIMGYVLDASLLSPVPPLEINPQPPRYEDALKPIAAPPKYEEHSTGNSSPSFMGALPPSNNTTARLESTVDETAHDNGSLSSLEDVTRRRSEGDFQPSPGNEEAESARSAR